MLPFQPIMIDWILKHPKCSVWAGMGMTKTVCTLMAFSEMLITGEARGMLLTAPHRVLAISWPNQIKRWQEVSWLKFANLRTEEGMQAWRDGSANIYGINSERLPSLEKRVKGGLKRYPGFVEKHIKGNKNLPVDMYVCDELSLAKNPSSKRFNTLRNFLHDIPGRYTSPFRRTLGLTGTPHPNSYLDVFAQIRLLDPSIFGSSFSRFRDTYFEKADYLGFTYKLRPGAKERIEEKLADFALVLLSEEWLDLPDCRIEDVEVVLPAATRTRYETLERDMLLDLERGGTITAAGAAPLTVKLLQLTAGCAYLDDAGVHFEHDAKIEALRKLRKKHAKEPILVLTSFIHERERYLREFPDAKHFHERDMGAWQEGKIPMWITDFRSVSHGIDGIQNSCRVAVWTSPPYSWEGFTQTNKRIHRPGQNDESVVYRLLCPDTIDDAVTATLEDKEEGERGMLAAIKGLQAMRKYI
jgi:hypothetical protein